MPTMAASNPMDIKTPLSSFIIDENKSAFDVAQPPPPPLSPTKFRYRPRHSSQTDFTDFMKKKEEEEKDSHFDSQINLILNSFAKQYMREYIKMKMKSSVYDTIDKELNRKSFTSNPQYYHLKRKDISSSPRHFSQHEDVSSDMRHNEGFQPVYSLRYLI